MTMWERKKEVGEEKGPVSKDSQTMTVNFFFTYLTMRKVDGPELVRTLLARFQRPLAGC